MSTGSVWSGLKSKTTLAQVSRALIRVFKDRMHGCHRDKLMSASCSARLIQLVKHFTNVKFKFYDGRWFITTAASLLLS